MTDLQLEKVRFKTGRRDCVAHSHNWRWPGVENPVSTASQAAPSNRSMTAADGNQIDAGN
jgi:hypothetical protein